MKVVSKKYLIRFWGLHKRSEQPLKAWHDEAVKASWQSPQDVKDQYRSASFIANNRVVFNIKGNDYRLIVAIAYRFGALYIKFIGTHAEYDKINAKTIEMEGV